MTLFGKEIRNADQFTEVIIKSFEEAFSLVGTDGAQQWAAPNGDTIYYYLEAPYKQWRAAFVITAEGDLYQFGICKPYALKTTGASLAEVHAASGLFPAVDTPIEEEPVVDEPIVDEPTEGEEPVEGETDTETPVDENPTEGEGDTDVEEPTNPEEGEPTEPEEPVDGGDVEPEVPVEEKPELPDAPEGMDIQEDDLGFYYYGVNEFGQDAKIYVKPPKNEVTPEEPGVDEPVDEVPTDGEETPEEPVDQPEEETPVVDEPTEPTEGETETPVEEVEKRDLNGRDVKITSDALYSIIENLFGKKYVVDEATGTRIYKLIKGVSAGLLSVEIFAHSVAEELKSVAFEVEGEVDFFELEEKIAAEVSTLIMPS